MTEPLASDQNEAYEDEQRESPGEMLDTALGEIPRRKAVHVGPAAKVGQVISLMNESSTGCALVVDEGKLVGIFTERDILQKMAGTSMDASSIIVKELMTPNPDTLPEDATVAFALNRMSVEGYRHIPVIDDSGKPLGVIGMRDVINWMVDTFPERILNVPPMPSSFPTKPEGG